MLYDIFETHPEIVVQLIQARFQIAPEQTRIQRERSYPTKGSIDIFIEFVNGGKKHALLIEVKVHDYFSATDGQISTYCNAVMNDGVYDKVYFIYLTQFTKGTDFTGIAAPGTINEAEAGKVLLGTRFVHMSWAQMHAFLEGYHGKLTKEQQLMVSLNRQWLVHQCETDLEDNKIDVGVRELEDYFTDVQGDIRNRLPFGTEVSENKRQIWRVDVSGLDERQMATLLEVIGTYVDSQSVNHLKQYNTEDTTLEAAKAFLANMAQNPEDWKLLAFYAGLFNLAEKTGYLKFYGTGIKGFSIKLEIRKKGEISLCTIYRNRRIDFSVKR
jgi:hypothetical protein